MYFVLVVKDQYANKINSMTRLLSEWQILYFDQTAVLFRINNEPGTFHLFQGFYHVHRDDNYSLQSDQVKSGRSE